MPGPWHIALGDLTCVVRASAPRDALASPEAVNDLLATTLALAREAATSDALRAGERHRLDRARPTLGGGCA
jgi:hypothetical protein